VIVSDAKPDRTDEQPDAASTGEPFLERWSRRKRAQDQATNTDQESEAAVAVPAVETAPAEPVLTDADMPPVESLDSESDFSPFMSPGVSEQLRTRALRKLFHLPAFNITDGLNDYDEDFTRFAGLGDTVTHEMKRMLQRELEERSRVEEQEAGGADDRTRADIAAQAEDGQRSEADDSEADDAKEIS
jgi:hypothetical protein